MYFKVKQS